MHNYRKYKSDRGEYADYRKATKILKKEQEEKSEEDIKTLLGGEDEK
jgi:hypothetical protein